jgi:hypothetical protein
VHSLWCAPVEVNISRKFIMKNSSFQPASYSPVQLHDTQPDTNVKETPQERVERLYAEDGGPLLGWHIDETQLRGQLLSDMATDLHVTYGYIKQLRNGIRKVSNVSNEFARSCANYLGVPTVVVKLVSGSISLSDFAWPALDEDMVVELAFQRMQTDPNVRPSLPRHAQKLPVAAKRAMVMMYADITGVDLFGVRQLPDIVHWLQRAAILHDGHEGQAMEAKLRRQLISEGSDLTSHVAA